MSPTFQLKSAISSNDNETVKKLLENMDMEAVNNMEKDETALHVACHTKNEEVLDSLLAKTGIDVNVKGKAGLTPLHTACSRGNLQAVVKLLAKPEIDVNDVNAKSIYGYTPLHLACLKVHLIVGKLLASPGIDVNAKDYAGVTPIMECVVFCKKAALKAMLDDPRVSLDIKDKNGRGLEEKGRDMCVEMIKKERMRREKEEEKEKTIPTGSIGRGIVKIEKINKEIVMEEEKSNKNLDIRKRKMGDLVKKKTLDKKILSKKHKEESFLLERNQSHEITTLQDTSAREDYDERRYIASLKEHRDELAQEIEKLTNDAGNGASSHERSKLEPITKSL